MDLQERDRRAKFGKQDQPEPSGRKKAKAKQLELIKKQANTVYGLISQTP